MSSLSSQAGVNFTYNSNGTFSIAGNTVGTNQNLNIGSSDSNTEANLDKLFGTSLSNYTSAKANGNDGSFNLTEPNGSSNTVTESSNQFSIDGINYNFTNNVSSSAPVTIGVTMNVSSVVTKIQNFVNDYNNLIGGVQDLINEKKNLSYGVLTTMQEAQMTSTQITAWNQQAQQGLLSNDDTLNTMLTSMREAFYTPVQGNSLTMSDVGLSTSDDYTQGGKLTLDTSELTSALQSNPQQVINLFAQVSTSYSSYTTALNSSSPNSNLQTRSNEEGIFQRLSDIYQQYAGTYLDNNGNQGILLMKAGESNTISDSNNSLNTQLTQEQQSVTDYMAKLTQDKTRYTNMFTSLQSAMSQLSTQQSYISSLLTSSSSSG
jgi:flagellar hook-associated protein 2